MLRKTRKILEQDSQVYMIFQLTEKIRLLVFESTCNNHFLFTYPCIHARIRSYNQQTFDFIFIIEPSICN